MAGTARIIGMHIGAGIHIGRSRGAGVHIGRSHGAGGILGVIIIGGLLPAGGARVTDGVRLRRDPRALTIPHMQAADQLLAGLASRAHIRPETYLVRAIWDEGDIPLIMAALRATVLFQDVR